MIVFSRDVAIHNQSVSRIYPQGSSVAAQKHRAPRVQLNIRNRMQYAAIHMQIPALADVPSSSGDIGNRSRHDIRRCSQLRIATDLKHSVVQKCISSVGVQTTKPGRAIARQNKIDRIQTIIGDHRRNRGQFLPEMIQHQIVIPCYPLACQRTSA